MTEKEKVMAELLLMNPRKRAGKKRTATRKTRDRRNPTPPIRARRAPVRRRARRNPAPAMNSVMSMVTNAAQGAAGALAIDAVMGFAPLPAMLKTGMMAHATRAGLALAIGLAGRKVLGRAAAKMAEGALTVAAYKLGHDLATGAGMKLAYAPMSPAQIVDGGSEFAPEMEMLPAESFAEYGADYSAMGEYVSEYVQY